MRAAFVFRRLEAEHGEEDGADAQTVVRSWRSLAAFFEELSLHDTHLAADAHDFLDDVLVEFWMALCAENVERACRCWA